MDLRLTLQNDFRLNALQQTKVIDRLHPASMSGIAAKQLKDKPWTVALPWTRFAVLERERDGRGG